MVGVVFGGGFFFCYGGFWIFVWVGLIICVLEFLD